jgi:hypothetical protein
MASILPFPRIAGMSRKYKKIDHLPKGRSFPDQENAGRVVSCLDMVGNEERDGAQVKWYKDAILSPGPKEYFRVVARSRKVWGVSHLNSVDKVDPTGIVASDSSRELIEQVLVDKETECHGSARRSTLHGFQPLPQFYHRGPRGRRTGQSVDIRPGIRDICIQFRLIFEVKRDDFVD